MVKGNNVFCRGENWHFLKNFILNLLSGSKPSGHVFGNCTVIVIFNIASRFFFFEIAIGIYQEAI